MTRPKRCDFQGAIHLLTISGYPDGHVFYEPRIFELFPENPRAHAPNIELFESLLWQSCEQYDGSVHAYAMEPNAAKLVIQTSGAPLSWLTHDLLSRYSTQLVSQHQIPESQKPFPRRYKAQIVQPSKLAYAVRYVQRKEVASNPRRRAINHPFNSHQIYCGRRPRPKCFVVSVTRESLQTLGYFGAKAYFDFMQTDDSPAITHMLNQRLIGESHFLEAVRRRSSQPSKTPSPDQLLQTVTETILHAAPNVACAPTHRGALARALVAWYAMRTGAAQIGTVGTWFGVTSSDLRYLIRQHQRKSPQYFHRPLADLFPEQ